MKNKNRTFGKECNWYINNTGTGGCIIAGNLHVQWKNNDFKHDRF